MKDTEAEAEDEEMARKEEEEEVCGPEVSRSSSKSDTGVGAGSGVQIAPEPDQHPQQYQQFERLRVPRAGGSFIGGAGKEKEGGEKEGEEVGEEVANEVGIAETREEENELRVVEEYAQHGTETAIAASTYTTTTIAPTSSKTFASIAQRSAFDRKFASQQPLDHAPHNAAVVDPVCEYMQQHVASLMDQFNEKQCQLDGPTFARLSSLICEDCSGSTTREPNSDAQWKIVALVLAAISVLSMILLFVARMKVALLQYEMARERTAPPSSVSSQRPRARSRSSSAPSLFATPADRSTTHSRTADLADMPS